MFNLLFIQFHIAKDFRMNWVGGARSRLKLPNERKLQKEYFERKRLSAKSQGQAVDQKAPISKDLLFLSKAAENDYTDRSPRAVPTKVNLDSAVKHPGRDLELPMSPIEKPSTLNLTDTSLVSSLNHSFCPPHLSTNTLPKVSTMKLPQARPVIGNILEANQKRENVSYMSESLFPAMKHPGQVKAKRQSSIDARMSSKKYSLDELLNSSQNRDNHVLKQQLARQKQAPPKTLSRHSGDLLWANLGGMLGRKRPGSVNPGIQQKPAKRPVTKPKKDTGYDFSGWVSRLLHKPTNNTSKVNDKEATLEIHYAPDEPTTANQLPKPQANRENSKKSWPLLSTLLTENPFSDHHKHSKTFQSKETVQPKSKSQNESVLNESILGPIKKAQAKPAVVKKTKQRQSNAFEKMMASFEKIDQKEPELSTIGILSEVPLKENKPQRNLSSCWKTFVSGDVEEPLVQEEPLKKTKRPVLKNKKGLNCSAWEELLSLEQEAFGLDTCTQELTLSPLDCTEEPLLRQVPDLTTKSLLKFHHFDSSQDSFISTKSSYSDSHSQSQQLEPNDPSQLTNPTKLSEMVCEEYLPTICLSTLIANTELTVPAFSNIVEVTTETVNNAASHEQKDSNPPPPKSTIKTFATLSTQTTPNVICQPATKNQEQQTIHPKLSSQSTINVITPSKSNKECKNVATQAGSISTELLALKQEVSRLQEELGSAESTIVWQSLMLSIKDI